MNATRTTRLLVEGGGDGLPAAAKALFGAWVSAHMLEEGDDAASENVLLIVPWASERDPAEILADYTVRHIILIHQCSILIEFLDVPHACLGCAHRNIFRVGSPPLQYLAPWHHP